MKPVSVKSKIRRQVVSNISRPMNSRIWGTIYIEVQDSVHNRVDSQVRQPLIDSLRHRGII